MLSYPRCFPLSGDFWLWFEIRPSKIWSFDQYLRNYGTYSTIEVIHIEFQELKLVSENLENKTVTQLHILKNYIFKEELLKT